MLAHGRWFSPASSTTKTGRHDIAEILLKVALSTINQIVFVQWCPTNIVLCFCFVFLRLVCPSMLPIFWIILFWLALRYYLTFIPLWYLHYFQWISTCTYVTDTLKTLVRDSCWKSKIDFCSQDHENNDQKNRQLRHPIKENKINSYQDIYVAILYPELSFPLSSTTSLSTPILQDFCKI